MEKKNEEKTDTSAIDEMDFIGGEGWKFYRITQFVAKRHDNDDDELAMKLFRDR